MDTIQSWEWWNPAEWQNMVRLVSEALQVPASYIGRVDDFGDESEEGDARRPVIRYPFAYPADQAELVSNQILPEGSGVSWRALIPVAVAEERAEDATDIPEGAEPPTRMELQHVLIDEVMDDDDIVFHGMPQLGSFSAIPLVYSSALTVEGLTNAKQAILEQRAQRQSLEEAEKARARIFAEKEAARKIEQEEIEAKIEQLREDLNNALSELEQPADEGEEAVEEEPENVTELRENLQAAEAELQEFLNPSSVEKDSEEDNDEEEPLPTVMTDAELLESLPRREIRNIISIDSLGSPHAIRSNFEVMHACRIANKIAELVRSREDAALLQQAEWELSSKPSDLKMKLDEAADIQKAEHERLADEIREDALKVALEKEKARRAALEAYLSAEKTRREVAAKLATPPPAEGENLKDAEENEEEVAAAVEAEIALDVNLSSLAETAIDKFANLKVTQNIIIETLGDIIQLSDFRIVNTAVEEILYLAYSLALAHGSFTNGLSESAKIGLDRLQHTSLFLQGSDSRLDSVSLRLLVDSHTLTLLASIQVGGSRVYSTEDHLLVNLKDRLSSLQQLLEERQNEMAAAAEDEENNLGLRSFDSGSHPAATAILKFIQAAVAARDADVSARRTVEEEARNDFEQSKSEFDTKMEEWQAERSSNIERKEQLQVDLAVAEGVQNENTAGNTEEGDDQDDEIESNADQSQVEELRKELKQLDIAYVQLLLKEPIFPIKPQFERDDDIIVEDENDGPQ